MRHLRKNITEKPCLTIKKCQNVFVEQFSPKDQVAFTRLIQSLKRDETEFDDAFLERDRGEKEIVKDLLSRNREGFLNAVASSDAVIQGEMDQLIQQIDEGDL